MFKPTSIAIFGASSALALAFKRYFESTIELENLFLFSRSPVGDLGPKTSWYPLNYDTELSFQGAVDALPNKQNFDLVLICSGLLHEGELQPEKTYKQVDLSDMQKVFQVNAFAPMMIAKYFLPRMLSNRESTFAALSARVGSLGDNRLGGWYSYRASKCALNMFLKTLSIECKMRLPLCKVLGLHPGTVNTPLSRPFAKKTSYKLFTPSESCLHLLKVLDSCQLQDSGHVFSWDGKRIMD